MATATATLTKSDARARSDAHAQKMESARARLRKAEEESAWREYERMRKINDERAKQDGDMVIRAARFVSLAEG